MAIAETPGASASFPNAVSVDWLANHLNDPQVVIIDCRFSLADPHLGQRQYAAGHIPGAHYLDLNRDLSSPVQTHGGRHPLPDWDVFGQRLEQLGVCSAGPHGPTQVVVYDDSRFAFAARLWWMLKYLSHGTVAVLDGGWGAWQRSGYAVSTAVPDPTMGRFIPQPQPHWVVNIDDVRRRQDKPGVLLIDSREPARYRGEVEPIDPVAGHIPGSENLFWQTASTDGGILKPAAAQAQRWDSFPEAEEVILYCGSGVTACVNLLSQALAGQPLAKLYVGGWSDWCSYNHRSCP
ncbi:sulfurtransferase [Leptolyngbya sp. BL0902]|uniref:sulfurtransferase n=1 Tax=Leptolyngbya sp. BL0902 TaxID=1115757 RepID=UPI0018E6F0AF|nr:sulfurtransferase [Leptolyngbya sp. BL0902]QQE65815.1 sulfurtransferase [Leptolyngbya sp. BL0902]